MKMQDLMVRFTHLPEQIFNKLDGESLFKCREVAKLWQNLIDGRIYPWLRIVNIPTILKEKNTYLHLAAETGEIQAFKTAFSEEWDKNIKNECNETSFHLACKNGRTDVVKIFLENAAKFGIDLNETAKYGWTAFYIACNEGHLNMVKIFMENATSLTIDLNKQSNRGVTAFHSACISGHSDIVKIFMENAEALKIDLNKEADNGMTAFHSACIMGHSDMVKIFMENATALKIDLNKETNNGNTAFQNACSKGHSDVVKIFLDSAATLSIDLNKRNNYALKLACKHDHKKILELLLSSADFKKNFKNKDFKMVTRYYPVVFMEGRQFLDIWDEF